MKDMVADHPLVSVVLLSYDRPDYLKESLDSIIGQSYENLEIIVVDNKSPSSDQIEQIVSQHPAVKLIANRANLGFTGGMNKGLSEASGTFVYLTEDDIVTNRNCISHLVEYAGRHAPIGLIAPIMYNKSDNTIRCAGGNFAFKAVYTNRIIGTGEKDTGQFSEPFGVTFIPGAAIFSRLELLRHLKGFREDFFMYMEDVELCTRVLKEGRRITVVPQAKVFHFEPSLLPVSEEIEFHKLKNFFSLYLLHAPLRVLPEFICRYGLLGIMRSAIGSQKRCALLLKAWWWVLRNMPDLVRDRYSSV